MKIATVVGARPQFIKSAPVSRALREQGIEEILIHTGQHYDDKMSKVFFEQMELSQPDINLEIGSATHGVQTGRMLEAIETVLLDRKPDWVLVYGDTNSTLAGALAAAKIGLPVAHVEAGLRSFNRAMPEEINRVVTDQISERLFTPTVTAGENLRREGLSPERIVQVGDVMLDAAIHFLEMAESRGLAPDDWGFGAGEYILATVHRAENTDDPIRLKAIFDGLAEVSCSIPIVLPMHPRTRHVLEKSNISVRHENISIIEPVGYLEMLVLEKNARLIATDSGGVQKEAFFFDVPCVTLRDETEWVETVELGWNIIAKPTSPENVVGKIFAMLEKEKPTQGRNDKEGPYGNGKSAVSIARSLKTTS
ncbi:MAG: UDP-N-acetylglucosamine 2-epimerase (non-hydrolyzing) [Rhodospirillales bacterium]|nr:UDP-N-acetylglucosamine 2-epimerase (non-hydrolyzing) [Rhodospirillales bacterium]